jgi:peroxiredoxin-like protein
VPIKAVGLSAIDSAPPKEFDGPGDRWSPESLLTAAVADCFVLSFRAVAAASKFAWTDLNCHTEGKLDRVEGKSRFTHFHTKATLRVPAGADAERAKKLLEKAEQVCLIANSLNAERHLVAEVIAG